MKILGIGNAIVDVICKVNDNFIEHGTIDELQKINGIDSASIKQVIQSLS